MQTTARPQSLQRTDMRIGFVIMALLGLLTVGAIVTAEHANAPSAVVEPQANTLPQAPLIPVPYVDRQQFIETNRLPDASFVPVVSFEQMRFIEMNMEMNMLPGDDAPLIAPASDRPGERH